MKQRQRPFLPPIDATGDLGSHHRSRQIMATKGYAWKHLPTGMIVQTHVAPTEDVLRIQSGLAEGQKVSYEEHTDPKRGKTSAEDLKAV